MADNVVPIKSPEINAFDLDAEAAVLSGILNAPERYDEVVSICPSRTFYSDANRRVMEGIESLAATGRTIDVVTLGQELQISNRLAQIGGLPYLATLIDAQPYYVNIVEHARIVREKWRLRRAREEALRLSAAIKTTVFRPDEVQALLEDAESIFSELAHEHAAQHLVPLRTVLADAYQSLYTASQNGAAITGIATGLSLVDKRTSGLQRGDLYVIAGRPGSGKSALAMNVAENIAAQGYGSAVFSLEMSGAQLVQRILSAQAKIDLARFRAPTSLTRDWPKIISAMATIDPYPMWIDDTAGITIPEIAARVRKLKSDIAHRRTHVPCNELVVVVVDYMQLVEVQQSKGQNREQEVSYVSRSLKLLAKRENVIVIGLSQLNRSGVKRGGDRRPQLEDLRESGAIEQDADGVFFVHRPEMFSADDPSVRGIAEIVIGKQRNGPTGVIRVKYTAEYVSFTDLAYDEFDEYDGFQDDLTRP